jgi:hypothetical protein
MTASFDRRRFLQQVAATGAAVGALDRSAGGPPAAGAPVPSKDLPRVPDQTLRLCRGRENRYPQGR